MLDEFVNLPVDRRADVNENITFVLRTWLVTIRCSVWERERPRKKGDRNYNTYSSVQTIHTHQVQCMFQRLPLQPPSASAIQPSKVPL